MKKYFLLWASVLLFSAPLQAQQSPLSNNADEPIEISAQESLEWLQNLRQYKANGSVIVTQGNLSLNADSLIADYDDTSGDALSITLITATGNIILKDLENTAYGDKITYNLRTNDIVLTGSNIKLTTSEQTITAQDELTYNTEKGSAKAVGNAMIKTTKETLKADVITANFAKNSQTNKQELTTAIATGAVTISTKDEVITGNKGTYNAQNNTAEINGNVKITRGKNTLQGNRATVNLTTNVSQMFGDKNSGERVKGVFFPNSKNTTITQ